MPRSRRTIAKPASSPDRIADRIVDAILAGRLCAGQRLGEQSLADLFGCSRTLIREALARLSARGMVEVNARRGWFVVEPSPAEAREAFEARLAIETGLVHAMPDKLPATAIQRLRRHVAEERAAIRAGDPGERSYLLGDFHVCLAECVGNALLAEILRDLTARTTLIATLFQSTHDAARSCADHAEIVAALAAGDRALALRHVSEHLKAVAEHLGPRSAADDPLAALRTALDLRGDEAAPASAGASPAPRSRRRSGGLFTELLGSGVEPAGAAAPSTPPAPTTSSTPSSTRPRTRVAARRPLKESP
jgi:DNA-binding GntR family transcriptional regulator